MISLTVVGCGDGPSFESGVDVAPRFEGSASSLALLGEDVLDALTRADTTTLDGYRLTERQHNEVVWPELPASAPEVNFPVDYAWQNIQTRNTSALLRVLPIYADRELDFLRVECRGGIESFETFQVHTDCWVVFGDEEGTSWEAQGFKDVLERGGGFKVFRYYDERPRSYDGPSLP